MIQNEIFGFRVRTALSGTVDVSSPVREHAVNAARILAASEMLIECAKRLETILDATPAGQLWETDPNGMAVVLNPHSLRGFVAATLAKLEG